MLDWLETTSLALWVKESWGWPLALTLHAFGTAAVMGISLILCLRAYGMFRMIPLTSLGKLVPFIWVGLALQVVSGILLWLTKPARYLYSTAFDAKLVLILVGFLTAIYFKRMLNEEARDGTSTGTISYCGIQLITTTALAFAAAIMSNKLIQTYCGYAGPCSGLARLWTVALAPVALIVIIALMRVLDRKT